MIRKSQEKRVETVSQMRGGDGEITLQSILNGAEEMNQKGRLFSQITLPVGASIGFHVHEKESETFYIIAGEGKFTDNSDVVPFSVGDVLVTTAGNGHSVRNTGNVPLEMIALILYQ